MMTTKIDCIKLKRELQQKVLQEREKNGEVDHGSFADNIKDPKLAALWKALMTKKHKQAG